MPPKRTRGAGRRTQQPTPEEPAHDAALPAGLAEANDKPAVRRSKRLNNTAPEQSVEPVAPKTKKDKKKPEGEVPAAANPLAVAVNTTTTTTSESSSSAARDSRFPAPPPPRRVKEDEAILREAGGEQKLVRELMNKNKLLDKLIEENRELRASAGPLRLEVYKLKKRVAELEGKERKREAEEELKSERRKRVRMEAEQAASKDVVVLDDDDDKEI